MRRVDYLGFGLAESLFLTFFIIVGGCQQQDCDTTRKIEKACQLLSVEIESGDLLSMRKVTTPKGMTSMIEWTDSLQDKDKLRDLAMDLKEFNVSAVTDHDSLVVLALGEQNDIVGSTRGYVFLVLDSSGSFKIDLYRGGK